MPTKTQSGRFLIEKTPSGVKATHIKSGLNVGGFSHIAVKTLKHARKGIDSAEKQLTKEQLKILDSIGEGTILTSSVRTVQKAFVAAMQSEFPNGAWSVRG